jgi:predicted amidohydrolase YtcJ
VKPIIFATIPLILSIGILPVIPFSEAVERYEGTDPFQPEFECRAGQVLVFKFNANNQVCTSPSSAEMWAKHGMARILQSSTESVSIEQPTIPRETMAAVTERADTIYTNGEVYTVDDEQPWAQAFAVKDGKFIGVGSNHEIKRFEGTQTQNINLQGRMVLPGFIDTHQHWEIAGNKFQSCELPSSFIKPTMDSVIETIEGCISAGNDFNGWFVGVGLSESIFPNDTNKEFLDEIFPDRPAFLEIENGHDALVNSKGLEVLGITKDSEAPAGSDYAKDENGELTGRLIEDPAREWARSQIPFPPQESSYYVNGFKIAMDKTNANGITGFVEGMVRETELPYWEAFLNQYEPTVRGRIAIEAIGYGGPGTELYGKDIIEMTQKYDLKDWPVMVKIFADGTTEGENSALLEPYMNNPDKEHEKLTLPDDLFKKVLKDLDEHDLQFKVHVNGDRSARVTLDAIEEIVGERGFNENRHHTGHNSVVDPDDFSRYRDLEVPAEFILALTAPSAYYQSQIPILGEERWFEKTYPIGSIANKGGIVATGTDWPLTPGNPFINIQTAVTRQDVMDPDNEMVLNEKHRMTLPAAIQMYTINGAYVMHLEKIAGSIEEGKSADFVVISENIFDVPLNEIKDIKIRQTFFKGNQVYNQN